MMFNRLKRKFRWKAKQLAAGKSRYYGDGGTIHKTGYLDVETYNGTVVSVWFRCQPLPFHQTEVNQDRAVDQEAMYNHTAGHIGSSITGIELEDESM